MTAPTPYLLFPGTAREALEHYAAIFGGEVQSCSYAEFDRQDGPGEAIAHGQLDGPVSLQAADAATGEAPVRMEGAMLSLLGAAEPEVLHAWFDALAAGGEVVAPFEPKPWGDADGIVRDRFGISWLLGYQGARE